MTIIGVNKLNWGQQKRVLGRATPALCSEWTHTSGYAAPRECQCAPANSLGYGISLPMRGRVALDPV